VEVDSIAAIVTPHSSSQSRITRSDPVIVLNVRVSLLRRPRGPGDLPRPKTVHGVGNSEEILGRARKRRLMVRPVGAQPPKDVGLRIQRRHCRRGEVSVRTSSQHLPGPTGGTVRPTSLNSRTNCTLWVRTDHPTRPSELREYVQYVVKL